MNKSSFLLPAFFLIALAFFFNACKREYSYEGGGSIRDSVTIITPPPPPQAAVFTLSGEPADCSNPTVNGTYTAGISTTSINTVTVNVDVSSPGIYSIKTDTVNQISFSKIGTFTTTGNQSVTLTASGKPDASGIFYFTPNTGTSSCSFGVSVQNGPPWATYVLESNFGNPNPCTYHVSGVYKSGTSLAFANSVDVQVYVTALGNFTVQTNKVNGMDFAYSGTFTTIGSQKITLYGRGTPQAAGSFTFSPRIIGPAPLGGQTCAFTITVQ